MQSIAVSAVSRRAWLTFLAAMAVGPAVLTMGTLPVTGQTKHEYKFDPAKLTWLDYRRNDFGFRIEMPGQPAIITPEGQGQPKTPEAYVMFDRVTFAVVVKEVGGTPTPQQVNRILDGLARGLQVTFGIEPKSGRFTMNGAVGREDIFEFKDAMMHYRAVIHGGRIIQVYVHRQLPDDDIQPAADRFLRSFALLPITR
jgi:hypothetical protein